jgi:integrase
MKAGEFVFPGQARNKPLSNKAMERVLHRMNIQDATVHGFRSSFRDWAGNVSSFPREVVETALAHVIGDKAEQAYRRSDALEKRRKLMDAWAAYCERPTGNVVQIGKRKLPSLWPPASAGVSCRSADRTAI